MRLGERLVAQGKLTADELQLALRHKAATDEPLGVVLVGLCLVSTTDVLEAVLEQRRDRLGTGRLGDILVEQGLVSRRDIGRALALQRRDGRLLGEVLMEEGLLTLHDLLTVLEAQQHRSAEVDVRGPLEPDVC